MNKVVRHSIGQAIEAIRVDRCDPFVVKSLLIDLRDVSPNGSILREIGDFIAHPAERNQGLNHRNIRRMVSEMKMAFEKRGRFTIAPTFDGTRIFLELEKAVGQAGFDSQTRDSLRAKADEIVVCILCLLQGARFNGLPVTAETFLKADNGRLVLACKFPSTNLGVTVHGRRNMDFALPLITTTIDAPECVVHPKRNSGRLAPTFEVVRDSANRLSLRQVF